MGRLHMAAKAHLIGEGLLYVAVAHKASQRSQLHALDLALAVRIVYGVVGAVLVTVVALPSIRQLLSRLAIVDTVLSLSNLLLQVDLLVGPLCIAFFSFPFR